MYNKKRLVIDVPREIHEAVKAEASVRHTSIKRYVMRSVMEKLMQDTKHQVKK